MAASTTTEQMPAEVSAINSVTGNNLLSNIINDGVLPSRPDPDLSDPEFDDPREEGSQNPPGWLTGHRRIPNYRAPRVHPRWSHLTASMGEAFIVGLMFRGCRLLSVAHWLPNALGLESYDYFMYKVSGEW
ncbi:hypothetical protein MMC13_001256 [Lambiella insularis]|nr:hypothetical protein [Lambiella insularis]